MFVIVSFICTIIFVLFQKQFKKASIQFNKEKEFFINYMDSINDFETLKHIGEINMSTKLLSRDYL